MKNFRDGRFAIGLLLGISTTILLELCARFGSDIVRCIVDSKCQGFAKKYTGANDAGVWSWIRRMVSTEDTVAQWGMAFLSLAAVILLWNTLQSSKKTLRVTQEMANSTKQATHAAIKSAKDTGEIGRKQTRAYLFFTDVECRNLSAHDLNSSEPDFRVSYRVTNAGQSPAENIRVRVSVFLNDSRSKSIIGNLESNRADREFIAPSDGTPFNLNFPVDTEILRPFRNHDAYITIVFQAEFRDVFGEEHQVQTKFFSTFNTVRTGGTLCYFSDVRREQEEDESDN